ncbi:hypothetical protein KC362_g98 [Hortaea werneckii]|nr:hypothetical protein KC362_g98 [Hortaea werneckii]
MGEGEDEDGKEMLFASSSTRPSRIRKGVSLTVLIEKFRFIQRFAVDDGMKRIVNLEAVVDSYCVPLFGLPGQSRCPEVRDGDDLVREEVSEVEV